MSLIQTLFAPIIGFDNRSLIDRKPFSITWAGTSNPSLTAQDIIIPTYTASWSGTSSPVITVT